jgi:hypothetical protein
MLPGYAMESIYALRIPESTEPVEKVSMSHKS